MVIIPIFKHAFLWNFKQKYHYFIGIIFYCIKYYINLIDVPSLTFGKLMHIAVLGILFLHHSITLCRARAISITHFTYNLSCLCKKQKLVTFFHQFCVHKNLCPSLLGVIHDFLRGALVPGEHYEWVSPYRHRCIHVCVYAPGVCLCVNDITWYVDVFGRLLLYTAVHTCIYHL